MIRLYKFKRRKPHPIEPVRLIAGQQWFYMHCIDPETWPIFDQHTYRAMHLMKTGKLKEIPSAKADVYNSYKRQYIPFVRSLNFDQRKIDKALYTFGQFLKMARAYR
jgi:hypothetical protein